MEMSKDTAWLWGVSPEMFEEHGGVRAMSGHWSLNHRTVHVVFMDGFVWDHEG